MFGQKPCCFYDLRPYMSLLQGQSLDEFLKKMDEIVDLKEGEFPKTVSCFKIYVFYLRKLNTINSLIDTSSYNSNKYLKFNKLLYHV